MYLRKIFIDRARYNSENEYCPTCHKKIYWPEKYREKKFYKDYVRQHGQNGWTRKVVECRINRR